MLKVVETSPRRPHEREAIRIFRRDYEEALQPYEVGGLYGTQEGRKRRQTEQNCVKAVQLKEGGLPESQHIPILIRQQCFGTAIPVATALRDVQRVNIRRVSRDIALVRGGRC